MGCHDIRQRTTIAEGGGGSDLAARDRTRGGAEIDEQEGNGRASGNQRI